MYYLKVLLIAFIIAQIRQNTLHSPCQYWNLTLHIIIILCMFTLASLSMCSLSWVALLEFAGL